MRVFAAPKPQPGSDLERSALALSAQRDVRAQAQGVASCFVSERPLPRMVPRNSYGMRYQPDEARGLNHLDRAMRIVQDKGPRTKELVERGKQAFQRAAYGEAVDVFAHLVRFSKLNCVAPVAEICIGAMHCQGDLRGAAKGFELLGDPVRAWRFLALDLLLETHRSFGAEEPSARSLAERLQSRLEVPVDLAPILVHAERFLKDLAEERQLPEPKVSKARALIDPGGIAPPTHGGSARLAENPSTVLGALAESLKAARPKLGSEPE